MPPRHMRFLFSSHPPAKHPLNKSLIISIFTVFVCTLAVLLLSFFLYRYSKLLKQCISNKTIPSDGGVYKLRKFKYRQLKRATQSFSHSQKLGKGGFGVVYRGVLRNGKEVAVKKMDSSSLQGEREFQNELAICGGLESPYVVKLLGSCTHGRRVRLLVYECMQNRSLQESLFEKSNHVHLDWGKRFKIILDTAKALEYLHIHCNPCIIHGDVKPSNILLDSQFAAHLADFGLARLKTEDPFLELARMSASTEKFRPETPDRFRFGTPDRFSAGTPEMSRSSTSKGVLFAETTVVCVAENLTEGRKLFDDMASIGCLSPERHHTSCEATAGNIIPCSPNASTLSGQAEKLPRSSSNALKAATLPASQEPPCEGTSIVKVSLQENVPDGCTKVCLSDGEKAVLPPMSRNKKVSKNDFNPKVSDFGLAKVAPDEGSGHLSTRVMGTFGYVAPEYAMTGHLLVKSDVYSYGVVLLELLSGRKPVDMSQPAGQENLVTWARPLLSSREGLELLVDPALQNNLPFDNLARVAAIASMCVQPEVSHRPFMGEVVQALKLVHNDSDMNNGTGSSNVSQGGESGAESDLRAGGRHPWLVNRRAQYAPDSTSFLSPGSYQTRKSPRMTGGDRMIVRS